MAGYYVAKATLTSTGCFLKDSQNVTVNPMPVKPIAGSNTPVCFGSTLNLNASTTTSGVTYSWTGPNSFTSTNQNPSKSSVVVADGGSYIVTATLNGCSMKDTTNVLVYSNVPTPAPNNNGPYCIGSNINLTANTITGATYNWTGPNGFSSTAQNPTIPNGQSISSGTYSVTATVNGCTSAPGGTVVTMVQGPTILAYPSPGDSICLGKPLTLVATPNNAGAGATYQWLRNGSNGTGSSTGLTYYTSGVVDGDTFSIVLTPGAGAPCTTPVNSNKVGIHVLQYQTPFVTISSSDSISWPGVLINFHGTAGNAGTYPKYQWKLNGNNVQGATDSIWGATTLLNKDSVCIEVTSSYPCPSPAKVKACTAVKISTGIKDVAGDGISVYPDPFRDELIVMNTPRPGANNFSVAGHPRITSTTNSLQSSPEGTTIRLVNVLGRVVYSGVVTGEKTVINTSQLPGGNYVLVLTDKDGNKSTWKVVKE